MFLQVQFWSATNTGKMDDTSPDNITQSGTPTLKCQEENRDFVLQATELFGEQWRPKRKEGNFPRVQYMYAEYKVS